MGKEGVKFHNTELTPSSNDLPKAGMTMLSAVPCSETNGNQNVCDRAR